MRIWINTYFDYLGFALESSDWKNGKAFMEAIQNEIDYDDYIVEPYLNHNLSEKLKWKIYMDDYGNNLKKFISLFKKFYPRKYNKQKVIFI